MDVASIRLTLALVCTAYVGVEAWLILLNLAAVKRQQRIPEYFQEVVDLQTFERSREYSVHKAYLQLAKLIWTGIILFTLLYSDILGWFDVWLQSFAFSYLVHGTVFVFGVFFALSILELPFRLYSTFGIERRFGFNTMTLATWLSDQCKGLVLSLVLFTPLLMAVLWFMRHAGPYWWLYAWLFVALFQLTVLFLYPVYVAPLFNTFAPLEQGPLRDRLEELAQRLDFHTAGVFVMDGSKRSTHGNAYFTGFGRNKRIVLFDTLVESLEEQEVAAVLAHEIGHEKLNHIKKGVLLSLLLLGAGLWILSLLLGHEPLFAAFGFARATPWSALVLFAIFSEPIVFFIAPVLSSVSRTFEYQADRFAVDAVAAASPLQKALLSLSKKSLANLQPHRLYSFFHYSHPTLIERFTAMETYARSRFEN